MSEQTFTIIKPNAMKKDAIGGIISKFEEADLRVAAAKLVQLTREKCEEFYAEHKERPFFGELVDFMTSGPVLLMALSGDGAVAKARDVMGATDPEDAAEGTIRKIWGDNVGENAVHGSDSLDSAKRELELFFNSSEIINS